MSEDPQCPEDTCTSRYVVWWEVVSVERVGVPVNACCPGAAVQKSLALVNVHRSLRHGVRERTQPRLHRVEPRG